ESGLPTCLPTLACDANLIVERDRRLMEKRDYPNFLYTITVLTVIASCLTRPLLAQHRPSNTLRLDTGAQIYEAACVACHGIDGKGTPQPVAGFAPPDTFPDFTRCDQTTAEPDSAWKALILHGGEYRGFSQIMPSFSEALTSAQIDRVIGYLRSLCTESHWPRGELNLPRALVTEKAYP